MITQLPDNTYQLALAGLIVSQITVDGAFTLHLVPSMHGAPEDILLRIEQRPFSYSVQGTMGDVDTVQDPASAGPALRLQSRKVTDARVGADAVLTIAFEGEAWLRVPPDPNYEAWILTAGEWLAVSIPGGKLVWGPEKAEP